MEGLLPLSAVSVTKITVDKALQKNTEMVTKETEIELDDRNDEKPRSSVVSFAMDLPEKGEDDDDHESKE